MNMKRATLAIIIASMYCLAGPVLAGSSRLDFSNLPNNAVRTNLAWFAVCLDTGHADYLVSINGAKAVVSSEGGVRELVELNAGVNKITVVVKDKKGKKISTTTKTINCDMLYPLSERELLYVADGGNGDTIVLDTVGGYEVGVMPAVTIVAASADGTTVYDDGVRAYPVDHPWIVLAGRPDSIDKSIDPTGKYQVTDWYAWASGSIEVKNLRTGKTHETAGLSDYMGDVVFSPDGKWGYVGSYGNSYYGGGNVYVVELSTGKIKNKYGQFGASSLAISPSGKTVYASSHWTDDEKGQGSKDHRGVEVLKADGKGKLSLDKSYYLKSTNGYASTGLLTLKPAAK